LFDNAQLADCQFIDLQRAKASLLDHETADSKAADRHRTDGDCTHCRRAQRKRQQAGPGIGSGSRRYVSRHWNLHRVRRLR
jgi:Beta-lactamase